jgi:FkbM family methyltransferase
MNQMLKRFRMERGLYWPAMDVDCAKVIFDMAKDLDHVWPFITDWSACFQAGGNCGIWPRILATRFQNVYTAEPHPDNFVALTLNTAELPNVVRFQCALGDGTGLIKLALADHEKQNIGAYYVEAGGNIPTVLIDDFGLPTCGLIYLDIEGMELKALMGAYNTIERCRPVIVIEDKGLSDKYGTRKGDAEKWLAEHHHYKVAKRVHRDVILIP